MVVGRVWDPAEENTPWLKMRMEMIRGRSRPYYSRRCKETSTTDVESLPDDLLSEILVRVPADDLHDRARLVCRRWSRIISCAAFASTHLHHSSYGLVLTELGRRNPIYVKTTKQGQIEVSRLGCRCITTASCNGLLLEHPQRLVNSVHILNPTTKKAIPLPYNRYRFCGMGYSKTSMEYKVVQLRNNPARPLAPNLVILTVGVDTSWRQLHVDHLSSSLKFLTYSTRVVTEGFIHWGSDLGRRVLSLDMETEIITKTSLPPRACASSKNFYYLSTGRSLSLLFRLGDSTMWEVWEMKHVGGEWRKCTHFEFSSELLDDHELFHCPCGWVKYPEVLACRVRVGAGTRTVVFYNLRTNEIDSTKIHGAGGVQPYQHRNTLLWLNPS